MAKHLCDTCSKASSKARKEPKCADVEKKAEWADYGTAGLVRCSAYIKE